MQVVLQALQSKVATEATLLLVRLLRMEVVVVEQVTITTQALRKVRLVDLVVDQEQDLLPAVIRREVVGNLDKVLTEEKETLALTLLPVVVAAQVVPVVDLFLKVQEELVKNLIFLQIYKFMQLVVLVVDNLMDLQILEMVAVGDLPVPVDLVDLELS